MGVALMHSSRTSLIIPFGSTLVFVLDLLFMVCKSPDGQALVITLQQ